MKKKLFIIGCTADSTNLDLLYQMPEGHDHMLTDIVAEVGVDESIIEVIRENNDIVFVSPEWNGSYPWFFKKVIDACPENLFKGKTLSLIYWSGGNNNGIAIRNALVNLGISLKMNISTNLICLNNGDENGQKRVLDFIRE